MNDQELLRKYEMRNITQCDRIAILEAQNKQQADRIAELEKELAFMEGNYPEPTIAEKMKEFENLEQAFNKIAKLEKQSEPVAWLARNQLINKYIPISLEEKEKTLPHVLQLYDDWIPLYTTPQTKPLSDGEIYECWEKVGWHKESCIDEDLKFARAIEAKVRGEK